MCCLLALWTQPRACQGQVLTCGCTGTRCHAGTPSSAGRNRQQRQHSTVCVSICRQAEAGWGPPAAQLHTPAWACPGACFTAAEQMSALHCRAHTGVPRSLRRLLRLAPAALKTRPSTCMPSRHRNLPLPSAPPKSHRPDFRAQQCLIRVWRAALCHVAWMCKGAAAACVLLQPLAGLNLPCEVSEIAACHGPG